MERKISFSKLTPRKGILTKGTDQYTEQYRETIIELRSEIAQLRDIIKNQSLLMKLHLSESPNKQKVKTVNQSVNANKKTIQKIKEVETIKSKEKFMTDEDLKKLDYLSNLEKIDPTISNEIRKMYSEKELKPLIDVNNYDIYDRLLKADVSNITMAQLEEFEKKMENLFFDKLELENQIRIRVKDNSLQEKYTLIRGFYEKFVQLLNNKLLENIEKGAKLKTELKQYNESSLQSSKLKSAKNDLISQIDKNNLINETIKKLMSKFIMNTQLKEIYDLKQKYENLVKERNSFQVNNKKFQENLADTTKEKEEKCQKIFELSNELNKLKRVLVLRAKRQKDVETQLNSIESAINTKGRKTIMKKSIRKLIQNNSSS